MSISPRGELAVLAAAAEHVDLDAGRRPARASPFWGSAMIRRTRPSSASRPGSPSGRISTATAPSRFSAATTVSALGRVCISTPTCSPWRTPISSSPRTTLSIRLLDRLLRVGAVLEEQDDVLGRLLGAARRAAGRARSGCRGSRLPSRLSWSSWLAPCRRSTSRSVRVAPTAAPASACTVPIPAPSASWARAPSRSRPRSRRRAARPPPRSVPMPSGSSPSPARQCAQAATVGQVVSTAVEPTTRPKWPAGSVTS